MNNSAELVDTTNKFCCLLEDQIYPLFEIADGVGAAQEAASSSTHVLRMRYARKGAAGAARSLNDR